MAEVRPVDGGVDRMVSRDQAGGPVAGLEDEAIMARFVRDYLGLLDHRVAAITTQLESGHDMAAHVSLLSLESTSAMVGEKELSRIAGVIRGAVERGQKTTVPALVTAMTLEAGRVRQRLRQG